jgi:hypothetical protein
MQWEVLMLKFGAAIVAGFVAVTASTGAQAQCTPEDQLVIRDIQTATVDMMQGKQVDLNWLRSRSQTLTPGCAASLNTTQRDPDPGVCTPHQQEAAISCNGSRDYKGRLCDCHQFPR